MFVYPKSKARSHRYEEGRLGFPLLPSSPPAGGLTSTISSHFGQWGPHPVQRDRADFRQTAPLALPRHPCNITNRQSCRPVLRPSSQ